MWLLPRTTRWVLNFHSTALFWSVPTKHPLPSSGDFDKVLFFPMEYHLRQDSSSILRVPGPLAPRPSDLVHEQWLRALNFQGFTGARLLDLGCGSGYFPELAARQGARYAAGVDIVPPPVVGAKPPWYFYPVDLDGTHWTAQLNQSGFDLIFAFDIIEHLKSPVLFLEQCHQVLAPAGELYLTTPNTQSLERYRNPKHWSGAHDPQHRILFSKYSLNFLLTRCQFKVQTMRAPLQSLSFLPKLLQWDLGGQLLVKASKLTP